MTDSTEDVNQELDDILLDDLVEVQERTDSTENLNLTPGEEVHDERRQKVIESEIARVGGELEISESTQQMAVSLFQQYVEKADLTGNALEVLAVACLYAACKVESVPLNPDDFANVSESAYTRVILLRRTKSIASTLGLDPRSFFDPTQYVDQYCDDLNLDDKVAERAHEILTIADEAGIGGGKSPTGRAAAAIYNACLEMDRKVTQKEIGKAADVTSVTVRNRYQDQRELLPQLSNSTDSKSDTEPHVESQTDLSSYNDNKKESDQLDIEMSYFTPYVSEGIAEKLLSALNQLESADGDLVNSCVEICEMAHKSRRFEGIEADDGSLALAIIRKASVNLGQEISYPKLKRSIKDHDKKIYRVTSKLDGVL